MSLAAFDHPETPEKILKLYPELSQKEKTIAVATLASRKLYARALTEALAKAPFDGKRLTFQQPVKLKP